MNARCFLLTETGQVERYLRRYTLTRTCPNMAGSYSYHNAMVKLDVVQEFADGHFGEVGDERRSEPLKDHPLWPKTCSCGYEFEDDDTWQVFPQHLYKREDTGEVMTLRDAPAGAMWFADWMVRDPNQGWWRGPDGHCLMLRLFYGDDFCPDHRAANCTLPDDSAHKCWVRTGTVPNITIGKDGVTCGAGAGSFYSGRKPEGGFHWHGFCRNGELVQG